MCLLQWQDLCDAPFKRDGFDGLDEFEFSSSSAARCTVPGQLVAPVCDRLSSLTSLGASLDPQVFDPFAQVDDVIFPDTIFPDATLT
jgi:hypothetical protein